MGGISEPAGQVEPYKFTLGLAQAAESLGAEVVRGEVVGFATAGERIAGVRLASGALVEADATVLAMGPWTAPAAAQLGTEIGSRTFLVQCLRAEVPGGLPLHTLGASDHWILPKKNGEVILSMYGPDFLERPDLDASLTEEVKLECLRWRTRRSWSTGGICCPSRPRSRITGPYWGGCRGGATLSLRRDSARSGFARVRQQGRSWRSGSIRGWRRCGRGACWSGSLQRQGAANRITDEHGSRVDSYPPDAPWLRRVFDTNTSFQSFAWDASSDGGTFVHGLA